ncbi:MAG: hypothetical protein ACOYEV_05865 [Candidatus Nanopelagicales bacterium]
MPRLTLFLIALFNRPIISNAFDGSWITPIIGFFLLPYTTLVYVLIDNWKGSVDGFYWFFVVLAFLTDLGSYGGTYNRRGDLVRH